MSPYSSVSRLFSRHPGIFWSRPYHSIIDDSVKDILKKEDFPSAAVDKHGRLMVGAAVGVSGDYLDRVAELKKAKVDIITVDTAHGHTKSVIDAIKKIKKTR